jgi:phosphotransferase system HPr-like phosphotransfer protein
VIVEVVSKGRVCSVIGQAADEEIAVARLREAISSLARLQ